MASGKRKRQSKSPEHEEIPMGQRFLNFISVDDAKKWKDEIVESKGYVKLINSHHLCSKISIEELKSFKSINEYDGSFFAKWMECEVREESLKEPPNRHDTLCLRENTALYPSISDKLSEFFATNVCDCVTVQRHHITLRSMLDPLPLLSNNAGSEQGSHMCDTMCCISKHHLLVETKEVNYSRQSCHGVILKIHRNSSGVDRITTIKPCDHGRKPRRSMDKQLKYSCRKIRVIITTNNHVPLYK